MAATTTANLGQYPGEVAPPQENAGDDRALMTMPTLMATPRSLHDKKGCLGFDCWPYHTRPHCIWWSGTSVTNTIA